MAVCYKLGEKPSDYGLKDWEHDEYGRVDFSWIQSHDTDQNDENRIPLEEQKYELEDEEVEERKYLAHNKMCFYKEWEVYCHLYD